MIFHIADRDRWLQSKAAGSYTASTIGRELHEEGFIHLSFEEQVPFVASAFYAGMADLVLLHVDESKLTAELKVEQLDGAPEAFPHLYGPLNVDAVVDVTDPFVA